MIPSLLLILSQINPVSFSKVYFNIILPSTPSFFFAVVRSKHFSCRIRATCPVHLTPTGLITMIKSHENPMIYAVDKTPLNEQRSSVHCANMLDNYDRRPRKMMMRKAYSHRLKTFLYKQDVAICVMIIQDSDMEFSNAVFTISHSSVVLMSTECRTANYSTLSTQYSYILSTQFHTGVRMAFLLSINKEFLAQPSFCYDVDFRFFCSSYFLTASNRLELQGGESPRGHLRLFKVTDSLSASSESV
jgi:hypothetical protein